MSDSHDDKPSLREERNLLKARAALVRRVLDGELDAYVFDLGPILDVARGVQRRRFTLHDEYEMKLALCDNTEARLQARIVELEEQLSDESERTL